MKFVSLVLGLLFSMNTFAADTIPAEAKKACVAAFEQTILNIYSNTSAESVRMSRRLEFQQAQATDSRLVLMEITANFYVKWSGNKNEVPELAGARLVYDSTTGICKSILLGEYVRLQH